MQVVEVGHRSSTKIVDSEGPVGRKKSVSVPATATVTVIVTVIVTVTVTETVTQRASIGKHVP